MAKIGLVTFSNAFDNYGQVLQAYATQEYLKERSHDVYLVREINSRSIYINNRIKIFFKKVLFKLTRLDKFKKSLKAQLDRNKLILEKETDEIKHPRYFEKFRKTYFNIIDNSKSSLKSNNITVLCSGSDQIWAYHNSFYFLHFGGVSLKRISIASSTGNRTFTPKGKHLIKKWLNDYNMLTVRENSGVNLCNELGINKVKKILDPTFLLSCDQYNKITTGKKYKDNYVFVYLLRAESPVSLDDIYSFAKIINMNVKYVTGSGRKDDAPKIFAEIPEWLTLLRDASYVITNSFHGMAFSIIYEKKFLVLPRIGKTNNMNERIIELAKEMHLEDRLFSDDITIVLKDIDFSNAKKRILSNKMILDSLMSNCEL